MGFFLLLFLLISETTRYLLHFAKITTGGGWRGLSSRWRWRFAPAPFRCRLGPLSHVQFASNLPLLAEALSRSTSAFIRASPDDDWAWLELVFWASPPPCRHHERMGAFW